MDTYNAHEIEKHVEEYWKKNKVPEKALKFRRGKKKFYFLDGPPYATGDIHLGTAWNKILKDFYIRFFRMCGYDTWAQPGYDTHGVPIENKVEKKLRIKTKKEIEKFGIENFIKECRKFATEFIDVMSNQFFELGVWMDWKNPYLTLENSYMEGAWHTFKIAYQKGLLYKGNYPVHVCPHCVDLESTVLVDGGIRKIKELADCWKHNKIISFDINTKKLNATNPLGYMEHEEDVFIIKTKTGKILIASPDHPFWTKQGWKPLALLKPRIEVATYNNVESRLPKFTERGRLIINENSIKNVLKDLESEYNSSSFNNLPSNIKIAIKNFVNELRNKDLSYKQIIKNVEAKFKIVVSKSWISKILKTNTTTRYDLIITKLKELELIPLYSKSPKAFILTRLLGHIFGDGSITISYSKNRLFPKLNLFFSGKAHDLEEIKGDLKKLGYNCSPIYSEIKKSIVNGRLVSGISTYMKCESLSLTILFIVLGAPIGRKTEIKTKVPKWIEFNRKLVREFLATYFGSELDIIKPRKFEKGFEVLRLHITKDRKFEKNGLEFSKKICKLINRFGVTTRNKIKIDKVTINGKEKSTFTISIDCNDNNIIKFTSFLGYEYCKERKIRASHALGYLLLKKSIEKKKQEIKDKILTLRENEIPCSKIATKLNLPELYVRHVVYGKSKSTRAAKYIPKFTVWLKEATENLEDGLIWNEIDIIKYLGKRKVCDIAVENHHNFITNGFLTHNCETAVAYNEIEYNNIEDTSIYVKFPILGKEKEYLLIWTTTPWTLPANTGIMVNPNFDYARIKIDGETLVIAKGLVETVMKKANIHHYKILSETKGQELVELQYTNPLKEHLPLQQEITGRVVLSEQFVSLEEGTGLVHTAPGHGKEDYKVGKEYKLDALSPLNLDGTFKEEAGFLYKKYAKDADHLIVAELEKRNAILHKDKIKHEYPFCWRCSNPLLLMSVPQWFLKITDIRQKLLNENEKVRWIPEWAGKRFQNWLENLDDWPISRQRYWGIPLPIWICERCGNTRIVGSLKEIPVKLKDYHKPYIDSVTFECDKCNSTMRRIPDVLDVWFDSGVASWASLQYPSKKDVFKKMWPADLNIEGSDQFRGWWNSQIITSVITFDRKPFESIVYHGFVLDAHGTKMAKSKGNVVTPKDVITKYGRDILRYHLLRYDSSNDFNFDWKDVEKVLRFFTIFFNSVKFFNTYCKKSRNLRNLKAEDRWILSRVNTLVRQCEESNKNYLAFKSAELIENFVIEDLSHTYIKLIRNRVWTAYKGKDKEAAFATLYYVIGRLIKLLAPYCPFLTEYINLSMYSKKSLHLSDWPEVEKRFLSEKLEMQMRLVNKMIEVTNAMRHEKDLKLKYPLLSITIEGKEDFAEAAENLKDVIKLMTNVKEIKFGKAEVGKEFEGGKVSLDTTLPLELKEEWLIRELIRNVQAARKKLNLKVTDKVKLCLSQEFEKHKNEIENETGSKIFFEKIEGKKFEFGFEKKKYEFSIKV